MAITAIGKHCRSNIYQTSLYLIFIFQALFQLSTSQTDIRLPPSIIEGPPTDFVFQASSRIELACEAVGSAALNYIWQKDGNAIDCTTNSRYLCVGNKIAAIENSQAADEGYYQCFVDNAYGLTMSNVMHLRMMTYSPGSTITESILTSINAGVELPCKAPYSVPSVDEAAENANATVPAIDWGIFENGADDNNQKPLPTSQRVQINRRTGSLYFANFDAPGSTFYKCILRLPGGNVFSGYTNVTVDGAVSNFPTTNLFNTMIPSVGLEQQSVIFQCMFSGRPTPQLNAASWKKVGGSLPVGRFDYSDFNTKLTIKNLEPSDAGDYTCEPSGQPALAQTMTLRVEAEPVFQSEEDMPHNINATDQDTITVNCSAYAVPEASVTWFRNGERLVQGSLPEKFQLSPDGTQLTISDLCKNCAGGTSDLMTLQCNASNIHGHNFVQGYLNVLLRTTIQTVPQDNFVGQQLFEFACEATTDDSTPLSVTWLYSKDLEPPELVNPDGIIRTIGPDNMLRIDLRNATDAQLREYCGFYTCQADNGFSSSSIEWPLFCDAVIVQSSSTWWIGLIVGLLILLLLLLALLLYCCCMKDSDGDIYLVDEKERENGNDPVQELRDDDFKDYMRDGMPNYSIDNNNKERSAANTLERSNYGGATNQHPSNGGFVTFGLEPAPAYEPYDFNTQQVQMQRNSGAAAVLYTTQNGGLVHLTTDYGDGQSIDSGITEEGRIKPFTPVTFTTVQPNQIQLIENGVPYGGSAARNPEISGSRRESGSQYGGSVRNQSLSRNQLYDVDLTENEFRNSRLAIHEQRQQQPQLQQFQPQQYDYRMDDGFQVGAYDQNPNQQNYYGSDQRLPYAVNSNNYDQSHQGYDQQVPGAYNINNQRIEYDDDNDDDDFGYRQERPYTAPTGWDALNLHNNDNVTSDV